MPLKGVTIGDCGKKIGMQGVDNGFILFNNFRISRVNLLNRFSDVTEDGQFKSNIDSADQRFAL
jgi:acyl-CoA oxidase